MAARQGEASTSTALEASDSGDLGQEPETPAEEGLTDAQLMEVFKQTSIFNVKSALANNENLVQAEADDELQTDLISDSDLSDTDEWEYLRGFWSGMHSMQQFDKRITAFPMHVQIVALSASDSHKHSAPAVLWYKDQLQVTLRRRRHIPDTCVYSKAVIFSVLPFYPVISSM